MSRAASVVVISALLAGCQLPADSSTRELAPDIDPLGACLADGSPTGKLVPEQLSHAVAPLPARAGYARGQTWFEGPEPIVVGERSFERFGSVHHFGPVESAEEGVRLVRIGTYNGVPVYTTEAEQRSPESLYVPVQPGCYFQLYLLSYGPEHDRRRP